MSQIFYMHNFDRDFNCCNCKNDFSCFAYRFMDDGKSVEVGYAICKDQYVKKIGREIATKRLEEQPIIINIYDIIKKELEFENMFSVGFIKELDGRYIKPLFKRTVINDIIYREMIKRIYNSEDC